MGCAGCWPQHCGRKRVFSSRFSRHDLAAGFHSRQLRLHVPTDPAVAWQWRSLGRPHSLLPRHWLARISYRSHWDTSLRHTRGLLDNPSLSIHQGLCTARCRATIPPLSHPTFVPATIHQTMCDDMRPRQHCKAQLTRHFKCHLRSPLTAPASNRYRTSSRPPARKWLIILEPFCAICQLHAPSLKRRR